MNLLTKKEVKHTELYYLERIRPVAVEDISSEMKVFEVEELANTKYKSEARISMKVTPTRSLTAELLDALHPQKEGEGFGIPNSSRLFDSYFSSKEDVLEKPRSFYVEHKEESTVYLKRTEPSRKKECSRVNDLINQVASTYGGRLKQEAVNLLTTAIDAEIDKHNTKIREMLSNYVLRDNVDEGWIVSNLYTPEQAVWHKHETAEIMELDEKISKFRERRNAITRQKNTRRRAVMQKHLVEWTAGIPELQKFVEELEIDKAVEHSIRPLY